MGSTAKKFNSILDTDLSEAEVDLLSHINSLNVTFRGNPGSMRVQNIVGNTLINNPGLPSGLQNTLGAFYDDVGQRLIWMNADTTDNKFHGIYIYNNVVGTVQTLLMNGSGTDGDILGFDPNVPITSIVIIYQEDVNGDILLFVDSLGRITEINILQFLTNPYPVTKRSFIDLAKAPPSMPPRVTYENDLNVIANNTLNALFKFRVRWIYYDNMASVYSVGSQTPLPTYTYSGVIPSNATSNSRIRVCIPTGDIDVIRFELWMQQSTNDVQDSTWRLVNSFTKADLSIPSNAVYQFLFYNDGSYPVADPRESGQLFDYVPTLCQAIELLNGNSVIAANIQEGFNHTNVNYQINTSNVPCPTNVQNGVLFAAFQSGVDSYGSGSIQIILTGAGTNDGNGNPLTLPVSDLTYWVKAQLPDGTDKSFSFTASTNNIASILGSISGSASSAGYSLGASTLNSLTISMANVILLYAYATSTNPASADTGGFCYALKSAYNFVPAYFDSKGRTIGVENPTVGAINTQEDLTTGTIPNIQFVIRSRPPLYAFYWAPARTASLTYDKYEMWGCDQTILDVNVFTGQQYVYIGIQNMAQYNDDIQTAAEGIGDGGGTPDVGYTFSQGDRIRFQLRYPLGASPVQLTSANDYQIVSSEENPIINGIKIDGLFIKILYPSADINSNFDFGGSTNILPSNQPNYQNYKILIYNIAKHSINDTQEVFYDFGRLFPIGNPGTINAYHIAPDQTQSQDLSTPAIFNHTDGDFIYRSRTIPLGIPYYVQVAPCQFNAHQEVLTTTATSFDQNPVTNGSYEIRNQIQQGITLGITPSFSDNTAIFYNKESIATAVRFKGSCSLWANLGGTLSVYLYMANSSGAIATIYTWLRRQFDAPQQQDVSVQETYTVDFDAVLSVPANTKAWLSYIYTPVTNTNFFCQIGGYNCLVQPVINVTVPIIDKAFNDANYIVTNSSLRSLVYDQFAQQKKYETVFRWSLEDEFGTAINRINRWYYQNQGELDRSRGPIQRMKTRDRVIRFFQERGACEMGVYNTFIRNAVGTDILTYTDEILTTNNVRYYEGVYGLGGHPEGLISGKIQDYIYDPIRGYLMRLSQDGWVPISELYKGQYYIRSLITPYNQDLLTSDGFNSRLIGCYNYFEEEAIFVLQGGTINTQTQSPYTIGFNEGRNAFSSPYGFNPEWIVSVEEDFYSFVGGQLYWHNNGDNNTAPYCFFYGQQQSASITTVFNQYEDEKKTFLSLSELANQVWECPQIYTNEYSYGTTQQSSHLIAANFRYLEGKYSAGFMRDENSPGTWINGFRLKGNWIAIKLQVTNASNFVYLSELLLKFIDSPLNPK